MAVWSAQHIFKKKKKKKKISYLLIVFAQPVYSMLDLVRCFYDAYQVWQLFVATIFMLHNVFSVIYRRVKVKREKKKMEGGT